MDKARRRGGGRSILDGGGAAHPGHGRAYLWQPAFLTYLDHTAYDSLLRAVAKPAPSPQIAIVDVDEASVARLGQWPWPRYGWPACSTPSASGGGGGGAGFLLAEPDRTSLATIREEMARELGVRVEVAAPTPAGWTTTASWPTPWPGEPSSWA